MSAPGPSAEPYITALPSATLSSEAPAAGLTHSFRALRHRNYQYFIGGQVISLSGDGGFSMLMGDLLSLVQHKLAVKIVLFNNSSLNFVELEMKAAGILGSGTELVNPSFAKLAESVGILGLRAEKPEDVSPMLQQAFDHDGPALLEAVVNRQELLIPPSINFDEIRGFSLYMVRAVLNGRGDEVVDLARTNLFR